jgi:hypothetical protein
MSARSLTVAVVLLLLAALGLGLYVFHLKQRAEGNANATPGEAGTISEPVAGAPASITLFEASDDDASLYPRTTTLIVPEEHDRRAREVLRALISHYQGNSSAHPMDAGAEIREVYLVGNNLAIVDVNGPFADGHRSGILVEDLTLASMAQTLAATLPGITRMKLLVDGKERATLAGHADLIEPYEVNEAAALVRQH